MDELTKEIEYQGGIDTFSEWEDYDLLNETFNYEENKE